MSSPAADQPPSPPPEPSPRSIPDGGLTAGSWAGWGFFFFAAAVLYARFLFEHSYFPPFFEGEEGHILLGAQEVVEGAAAQGSWLGSFHGGALQYNKGFAWLFVPFYVAFAKNWDLLTIVFPALISLLVAGFFWLQRRASPWACLQSIIVVAALGIFVLSVRRYKWHPMAFVTALSLYGYFLPQLLPALAWARRWWVRPAAVLGLLVSCFLYYGCFIYILPFTALTVYFAPMADRRRWLRLTGLIAIVLLAGANIAYHHNDLWQWRITCELSNTLELLSIKNIGWRLLSLRDFVVLYLSPPYRLLFAAGIVASFLRAWRGETFAVVNSLTLLTLFIFLMAIAGFHNPDQLNWLMIPLLGLFVIGADALLRPLLRCVKGGVWLSWALVVIAVGFELHHYPEAVKMGFYQAHVQPRNARTQAALILRTILEDADPRHRYFLPDPSLPVSLTGLELTPSLSRTDYLAAFARITYFTSPADLHRKISALSPGDTPIAFMGTGESDSCLDNELVPGGRLLELPPQIIFPYLDVYRTEFPVRRYTFPTRGAPH